MTSNSPGLQRGLNVPDTVHPSLGDTMLYIDLSRYAKKTDAALAKVHQALYEAFYDLPFRRLIFFLLQLDEPEVAEVFEPNYAASFDTICGIAKLVDALADSYADGSLLFVIDDYGVAHIFPMCYSRTELAERLTSGARSRRGPLRLTTNPEEFINRWDLTDFILPEYPLTEHEPDIADTDPHRVEAVRDLERAPEDAGSWDASFGGAEAASSA
jgi:hypothetical protein